MKLKVYTLVISCCTILVAAFLYNPTWFGICIPYQTLNGDFCSAPYGYPYGVTLFPLSIAFLVASIGAFFTSSRTYKRWLRFSVGYGVVACILLIALPQMNFGGFPLVELNVLAQLLAWIYGGVSLVLLVVSSLVGVRKFS